MHYEVGACHAKYRYASFEHLTKIPRKFKILTLAHTWVSSSMSTKVSLVCSLKDDETVVISFS